MSDWLTERLHAGAASATSGITLDHPAGSGAESTGTPVGDTGNDGALPNGDVIVLADGGRPPLARPRCG